MELCGLRPYVVSIRLCMCLVFLAESERDINTNVHCSSCKVPLFWSYFNLTGFSRLIFVKYPRIKFNENPSSGSRGVPYERTDMTKLIVAFRNFYEKCTTK